MLVYVYAYTESFTTAYRYLVQILPSLIVAPLYFQHKIELGSISQSYGAFNHILGDFSIIINQFESISAFSAGTRCYCVYMQKHIYIVCMHVYTHGASAYTHMYKYCY